MSLGGVQGTQLLTLIGVETQLQDGRQRLGAAVQRARLRRRRGLCRVDRQARAALGPGGSLVPVCGEDIVSSVPAGTSSSGATCGGYGDTYDEYAGTSLATPHVAGVAALLAAQGRSVDNIYSTPDLDGPYAGAGSARRLRPDERVRDRRRRRGRPAGLTPPVVA
jgi:subtilisin family serine protease